MNRFMVLGPLTRDIIIKNNDVHRSIGGPVYYQTAVFSKLYAENTGIITLAESDADLLNDLPDNTDLFPIYTDKTYQFINIYPNTNLNHRIQKAIISKNSINPSDLFKINFNLYNALLLCPLSPYDIPLKTLKYLSKPKIPIYLGVQGYLRHIKDMRVILKPWKDFNKFLKFCNLLFLDEVEARVILGYNNNDELGKIAQEIASLGPEEVIITRGDLGALIYSKKDGKEFLYDIPTFPPEKLVDTTGLGDTFMAAYAYCKTKTENPQKCGIFASATCSLKMEDDGAFQGNLKLIKDKIKNRNIG